MPNWLSEYWLRLLFIAGYLALLAHHAWRARDASRNIGGYIGPRLGGWVIGLSFYATYVSTNSFIGNAGKSWDVGLIWYVKGVTIVACAYLAWYVVAPRFFVRAREYGSLTLADFLGRRYDSLALRRITAFVIFGASVLYLIAVYKGSALALQQFLGIDYRVAAVLIFCVVTAYTLTGGLRAVVHTDAAQGVLMAIGAVLLFFGVLRAGGGLAAIVEKVRAVDPDYVSWHGKMPMLTVFGLSLAGGMKMLVDPRQISRIYGLRDDRALRSARILSPILVLVTYLCLLPLGAFAHALIPADAIDDSDMVTLYLLNTLEVLGPTLSSFFLLVLLSAAMSSLDSVLLVAASSIGRDVIIVPDDDPKAIRWTRFGVVAVSLVGMLLALNPFGDIVSITAFAGSLYAACFLPAMIIGIYWRGGTRPAAIANVLLGSAVTVGWYFARRSGW
ncbi:hypothetical protein HOK31_29865, partial [Candidatus Poribacteria bacterium]|nr:hypothetical protein [Candidatus Poribacteria bacterium]